MGKANESLFSRLYNLYNADNTRFETWVSIFWRATQADESQKGLETLHLAALNGHDQVV